jgi:hypothetical protein
MLGQSARSTGHQAEPGSPEHDDEARAFAPLWDDVSIKRRQSLLRRVQRAAERSGTQPQLYAGTLLGYVREGKILDWDDDIDLALFGARGLKRFIEAARSEGLSTQREGPAKIKLYDAGFEPILRDPPLGPYPWTWPFIDLFVFKRRGGTFVCESPTNESTFPRAGVLPPQRSRRFERSRLWIPHDPYFVLDYWYADWREVEVSPSWIHRTESDAELTSTRAILTDDAGRKIRPRRKHAGRLMARA